MSAPRTTSNILVGAIFACTGFIWAADAISAPVEIKDCDQCPQMVVIPAGVFSMGSNEAGAEEDEGPPRSVTISKPFALGKYEITYDEWDACVADKACERTPDEGWGRGRRPVLHVNYAMAVGYGKWLSAKTGNSYRLPSEAEWEYSARAGSGPIRSWGSDAAAVCTHANVYDESAHMKYRFGWRPAKCDDKSVETAPVGSYAANAFALHDMLGNVWEWVADCYASYANAPADGGAASGMDCSKRISRGGSWNVFPTWVTASYRNGLEPILKSSNLGFRVLRELP